MNVFISHSRVDDWKGKRFQERLLFSDYPKRHLFQSREVNARCEPNILSDFRRKVAKGSRWRINVSHESVPWRKKDYFRPGGCTEIYNKTAPDRLELLLCSRPFTVHDLRVQIMPVKSLRVGFPAPREFILSSFRLTRDIHTSTTSGPLVCFVSRSIFIVTDKLVRRSIPGQMEDRETNEGGTDKEEEDLSLWSLENDRHRDEIRLNLPRFVPFGQPRIIFERCATTAPHCIRNQKSEVKVKGRSVYPEDRDFSGGWTIQSDDSVFPTVAKNVLHENGD